MCTCHVYIRWFRETSIIRQSVPIQYDLLVFFIALATRAIRPGLYFSFIDELNILNAAADIAYQGVWTWIGNPAN